MTRFTSIRLLCISSLILTTSVGCSSKDEAASATQAPAPKVSTPRALPAKATSEGGAVALASAPSAKTSPVAAVKASAPVALVKASAPVALVKEPALGSSASLASTLPGLPMFMVVSARSLAAFGAPMKMMGVDVGGKSPVELALADFKKKFKVDATPWLRTDAPIYLLVSDVKADAGNRALVLPVSDPVLAKKAFQALAESKGGHDVVFEDEGKSVYIDLLGNRVVMTYTDGFFKTLKPYVEAKLPGHKVSEILRVDLFVGALVKRYGETFFSGPDDVSRWIVQAFPSEDLKPQGDTLAKISELLFQTVHSTRHLSVAFNVEKGSLVVDLTIVPVKPAGSEKSALAKFVAEWSGRRSVLAHSIDPKALLAGAFHVDTRTIVNMRENLQTAVDGLTEIFNLGPKQQAQFMKLMERSQNNHRGDVAFSMGPDGPFPLGLTSVSVVASAKEEQKIHGQLMDFFFEILMKEAKAKLGDKPMAQMMLQADSFGSMVMQLRPILMPMGVSLDVVNRTEGATHVAGLTIAIDWAASPFRGKSPEVALVEKMMGSTFSFAFAYHGERFAMAIGPNGMAKAKALADGTFQGGQADLTRELADGVGAFKVRLPALVKVLQAFGVSKDPKAVAMAALGEAGNLMVQLKSDGSQARLRVKIPGALLAATR